MGTDEESMAVVYDEIGRAVGLPRALGGIPLDEIGATGYGLAQCAEVAAAHCGLKLQGSRVAIEGYGNVGRHAALFLEKLGATLVAASDTGGAIYNPDGIVASELSAHKATHGSVATYKKGKRIEPADLFTAPCDVLVPAARPDSIRADNAKAVEAKLILQGANIPATAEAERILHQRGITNVPDFIANAGGVICAAVEYHGGVESDAYRRIAEKIRRNTEEVLATSGRDGVLPREAALELARERVVEAMSYRNRGC